MAEEGTFRRGWQKLRMGETALAAATPGPEADPGPDGPSAEPPVRVGTFIGTGADFEGRLSLRGDFQIDSEFRGALETDGTIIVGPTGSVVGDIRAREVVIRGAVVGDIHARRQLVLEPEARLHGDIETACLEIARHAFFQGRTVMTRPQAATRSQPESVMSAETAL